MSPSPSRAPPRTVCENEKPSSERSIREPIKRASDEHVQLSTELVDEPSWNDHAGAGGGAGGSVGDGSGLGRRIVYAVEESPLGTGGAVKNAEPHLDDTTIVFNGDVLTDVDLPAVVAAHREKGAAASIVLTPVANPSAYGLVETDGQGWVRRFIEKPRPPRYVGRDTPVQAVDSSAIVSTPGYCKCTSSLNFLRKSMASRFSRPPKQFGSHSPSLRL